MIIYNFNVQRTERAALNVKLGGHAFSFAVFKLLYIVSGFIRVIVYSPSSQKLEMKLC